MNSQKLFAAAVLSALAADYEHTFTRLKILPGDVFLAPHGSVFHLQDKLNQLKAGSNSNPFIDVEGSRTFLAESEKAFRQKVQEQVRAASARN
jgi:metallo-beta-lactamase class B